MRSFQPGGISRTAASSPVVERTSAKGSPSCAYENLRAIRVIDRGALDRGGKPGSK